MTAEASVIVPTRIGFSELFDSDLPEIDYPEWTAGESCAIGTIRQVTSTHTLHESLINANTGNVPSPTSDTTAWKLLGDTNRWRLFNSSPSAVSTSTTTWTVKIRPSEPVGGIAIFRATADNVLLEITDLSDGSLMLREERSPSDAYIADWFAYAFAPLTRTGDIFWSCIPMAQRVEIRLTFFATYGPASVGALVVGPKYVLGAPTLGMSVRRVSLSKQEYRPGETLPYTFTSKPGYRQTDLKFNFDAKLFNSVNYVFELTDGRPCAWICVDQNGYQSACLLGVHKDPSITLPTNGMHNGSLPLYGMV